jgi:hypothetical protein
MLSPVWTILQAVEVSKKLTDGGTAIMYNKYLQKGTYLKDKALHIAACVGTRNLFASNGWVKRFKRW